MTADMALLVLEREAQDRLDELTSQIDRLDPSCDSQLLGWQTREMHEEAARLEKRIAELGAKYMQMKRVEHAAIIDAAIANQERSAAQ